ncbi:MAG: hypothetical protein J2P17_07980 [Mycobacterium sp.]|nr:hypothetical protein [Mycobacterium sp.]
MRIQDIRGRRIRGITALAVASTFLSQNVAWAVCSDGLGFPTGNQGYEFELLPASLQNFAPGVFTGTAGSVFVPDNSLTEGNSPTGTTTTANTSGIAGLPAVTVGGHNWEFDQGSTTCKATDTGPAGQPATGWAIPPNTTTDCFVLPVVKGGAFTNFGDVPFSGQAIIPTCDPTLLSTAGAPNPLNTRLNQLGCSISQLANGTPVANDQTTASAFLFTAGKQGGMFAEELENTPAGTPGDSGRVVASIRYYSDIPEGNKLTNPMVSPDGHFALVTSLRRNPNLFGCNNPLGDPGDITLPIPDVGTFANSADPSTNNPLGVKCISSIAQTGLSVTLTNVFGPDGQPYLGGQRTVTTANANPGSYFLSTAWPQCVVNGAGTGFVAGLSTAAQLDQALKSAFGAHFKGGCGTFTANAGFSAAAVVQPQAMTTYVAANGGQYIFTAGTAQPVVQVALGYLADGSTTYTTRTYMSGETGTVTGVGVAPDMSWGSTINTQGAPATATTGSGSLVVMNDPSGLGLAGQEIMTRLPLCEDFVGAGLPARPPAPHFAGGPPIIQLPLAGPVIPPVATGGGGGGTGGGGGGTGGGG